MSDHEEYAHLFRLKMNSCVSIMTTSYPKKGVNSRNVMYIKYFPAMKNTVHNIILVLLMRLLLQNAYQLLKMSMQNKAD